MPLVAYNSGDGFYDSIFTEHQIGHGEALTRYRGSLMQNGCGFMLPAFLRTLLTRISGFAKPLIKSAAPHMRSALDAAKPHLRTAAQSAVDEAAKAVGAKIGDALASTGNASVQQGGAKGKRNVRHRKSTKTSRKRTPRLSPYSLPDLI